MSSGQPGETNRRLGHAADARLLIINADDFGLCHAVNAAILGSLTEGVVCSTSVLTPCPWALHALRLLGDHFLISAEARELIRQEGITLLSYTPLQQVWQAGSSGARHC